MSFDPRYRDRIESGSRHYSNPYRQDLWSMNSYKAAVERGRDQMETHNQRVERQLIEKFQKNNFKAVSGGFTAFVHLGKGLVLILVAPPYFMLFIMPRWAFQTLMPAAEKAGELIEKAFMRVSAWSVDIFGVFSVKIAEFRSRMKKPKKEPKPKREVEIDPRLIEMKHKFLAGIQRVFTTFKHVSNGIAQIKIRFFERLNHMRMQAFKQVTSKYQKVKQRVLDIGEKIQLRVSNWLKPKLETAAKVFAAIDRAIEKTVRVISSPFKRVFEEAAKVVQPITHAAVVTTQFIQSVFAPPMQFMFKQAAKVIEKGTAAIERSAQAIQKGVTVLAQSLNVLAQTAFRPVALASAWAAQIAEKGIVNIAQRVSNLAKVVASVMKRAIESCLEKGQQQAKRFLQWAGRKGKEAGQVLIAAILTLKYLPGYLWKFFKFVLKLIYRGWRKASHSIRVMYVLTKHLVAQSLVQLERSLHKTQ